MKRKLDHEKKQGEKTEDEIISSSEDEIGNNFVLTGTMFRKSG